MDLGRRSSAFLDGATIGTNGCSVDGWWPAPERRSCSRKVRVCRIPAQDAHLFLSPEWSGQRAHIKSLLLQNATQGLYVEAYGLGNVRQRHPAVDELARDPHLLRVWG